MRLHPEGAAQIAHLEIPAFAGMTVLMSFVMPANAGISFLERNEFVQLVLRIYPEPESIWICGTCQNSVLSTVAR